MAQFLLNSRSHTAHGVSPFTALFGRSPAPLAAIENPELLPSEVDGDEFVRELSHRLRVLHRSLAAESDLIKQTAIEAYNRQFTSSAHSIVAGDEVWLMPGTSDHAAYVRKHGHGAPWRFKYTVLEVKPHAVRLDMTMAGETPRLEEWQSVRKCTKVRPVQEDLDSVAPQCDAHGRVLVHPDGTIPVEPPDEAPEPGVTRYLIERTTTCRASRPRMGRTREVARLRRRHRRAAECHHSRYSRRPGHLEPDSRCSKAIS